ncbi:MAG: putative rane protein [Deltaproteobacteria bacterium]|nr:putative rane protein [Deltaproteobacteria bacterium]
MQAVWIVMTVLAGSLFISTCGASEWVSYGADEAGEMQFDRDSVSWSSRESVTVWTRLVHSDEGKKRYTSSLQPDRLSKHKYDQLRNTDTLVEIDCRIKKAKLLLTEDYDTRGAPLHSGNLPSQWFSIVPGSVADELRGIVCTPPTMTSSEEAKGTAVPEAPGLSSSESKQETWIRRDE